MDGTFTHGYEKINFPFVKRGSRGIFQQDKPLKNPPWPLSKKEGESILKVKVGNRLISSFRVTPGKGANSLITMNYLRMVTLFMTTGVAGRSMGPV